MVRILANGDIVPDDDPRAQQASRRQTPNPPRSQGGFQSADAYYNQEQGQGQQINIFQALNQRLIAFGIPRWNIGDIVIEPIVSIGLLLALLVFGIHGLIFGLLLFAVSRWSTHGAPDFIRNLFGGGSDRADDSGSRGPRHQGRAGGGYRLGR